MKVDCQRLHDSGSFRPSNPHHIKIWRFWKQVQKNLEIGTSNLEISKVCVKLTDYLFEFFFYLFSPPCCILLLLFSLSSSGQWVAISRVSGSPWDLEAKPWDREMPSQTVRVGRYGSFQTLPFTQAELDAYEASVFSSLTGLGKRSDGVTKT